MWGLSYQQHDGTLVLVHGSHLAPTPFEAERSDPFLLVPAGLTPLDSAAPCALKGRLCRLGPPTKTIRWQTFGLDAALRAMQKAHSTPRAEDRRLRWRRTSTCGTRSACTGLAVSFVTRPPHRAALPGAAHLWPAGRRLRRHSRDGLPLLGGRVGAAAWCDGEVQIFEDYHDRVAAADEARRQLLPNPNQPVLSEVVQEAISRRRDQIQRRKICNRRRAPLRS